MGDASLTVKLKTEAIRLGFDLVGACRATTPPRIDRFREWLAAGCAGSMRYLPERANAYEHPRFVLDSVQSLVMLGVNYRTVEPAEAGPGKGRLSRYAWGADYHHLIRQRLAALADFHRELVPHARVRGVVDTAPLFEREFAELAGLGWIGKNSLLLNKRFGSWLFLAALLTSERLDVDEPFEGNHCGACRACLDACPTGALVGPYRVDARKCISYLTIELREGLPEALLGGTGDWLFGCDRCQEVCPWNDRTPASDEAAFQPGPNTNPALLGEILLLDGPAFRKRYFHTPLWRSRRRGLARSAAIVLGNRPHEPSLPALAAGLHDPEPEVRAACAWALGRFHLPAARESIRSRLLVESDDAVRAVMASALAES